MNQPAQLGTNQSATRLVLVLIVSIFFTELVIMALLRALPPPVSELHGWLEAVIDASVLGFVPKQLDE